MKAFNFKASQKGAKVMTREGVPVRIVSHNLGGDLPIMGIIEGKRVERCHFYSARGENIPGKVSPNDLVMDDSYERICGIITDFFVRFLNKRRRDSKEMCLSDMECADIEEAFKKQDWPRLFRYLRESVGKEAEE